MFGGFVTTRLNYRKTPASSYEACRKRRSGRGAEPGDAVKVPGEVAANANRLTPAAPPPISVLKPTTQVAETEESRVKVFWSKSKWRCSPFDAEPERRSRPPRTAQAKASAVVTIADAVKATQSQSESQTHPRSLTKKTAANDDRRRASERKRKKRDGASKQSSRSPTQVRAAQ